MKWFLGAFAMLGVAVWFGLELLAYSMYALLATMIVSRMLAHAWIHNLQAIRECNTLHANVGDTVAISVEIRNRGFLPIPWVLIEDQLPRAALGLRPPSLTIQGTTKKLAGLRGGKSVTLLYQVQCNRRGYYQLGPLVLETGDLFGLHRRWRIATEPHFLMVYPKVVPLQSFDVASRRPIGEVQITHRLFEDPTRIAGVRQYQAGDPLNRVHWRATARTGQLHSKVYEPSTVAGATILLEFQERAYAAKHEPYLSNLMVTAAASIANALYEMGQQVGLITNGHDAVDRIRTQGWDVQLHSRLQARQSAEMLPDSDRLRPMVVPTKRGHDQISQILRALARVELGRGLNLAQLIEESEGRMPRDATVMVFLPSVTQQNAIALANLKRRGYAVLAVLGIYDPADFEFAAEPLVAAGIGTVQLSEEEAIATICGKCTLGTGYMTGR